MLVRESRRERLCRRQVPNCPVPWARRECGKSAEPCLEAPALTRVQLGPLGPAEAAALGAPERACAGCVDGAKSLLMDLAGHSHSGPAGGRGGGGAETLPPGQWSGRKLHFDYFLCVASERHSPHTLL